MISRKIEKEFIYFRCSPINIALPKTKRNIDIIKEILDGLIEEKPKEEQTQEEETEEFVESYEEQNKPKKTGRPKIKHGEGKCPKCGSNNKVGDGVRYTKLRGKLQKYRCRECGHRFTERGSGYGTKYPKEIIKKGLKLHKEGLDYRGIVKSLKESEGMDVAPSSVMRWVKKYKSKEKKKVGRPKLKIPADKIQFEADLKKDSKETSETKKEEPKEKSNGEKNKVGRPKKELGKGVKKQIMDLLKEGFSARAITRLIEEEHSIDIHYNTILNIIKEQQKEPTEQKEKVTEEVIEEKPETKEDILKNQSDLFKKKFKEIRQKFPYITDENVMERVELALK